MTDLTRRIFFAGAAGALAATGLDGLVLGANTADADQKEAFVTFKQALADKDNTRGSRQKYLQQLVKRLGYDGQIGEVIYDHDSSKIDREFKNVEAIFKNPEILMEGVNIYLHHAQKGFWQLSPEQKAGRRKETLDLPEESQKFKDYLMRGREKTERVGVVIPTRGMGIKQKSKVYITREFFQPDESIEVNKIKYRFEPSELSAIIILTHEWFHAYQNSTGIDLENYRISYPRHLDFQPSVTLILNELGAYMHQIKKAREIENPNPNFWNTLDFDRLPKTYLMSVLSLAVYISKVQGNLKPENATMQEYNFLRTQLSNVKTNVPELSIFPTINQLYQRFGIK